MSFIIFFLLTVTISLTLFYRMMVSAIPSVKEDAVSIAEMEHSEDDIIARFVSYLDKYRNNAESKAHEDLNVYDLADGLHLKIEKTDIQGTMRGVLVPSDVPEFNGVIRIPKGEKELYAEEFDIMHEIAHYLLDVGMNKRVGALYTRLPHGDRKSHKEQVIDYYAAAMAIPEESLRRRIYQSDKDPYDDVFIAELVEVYKQPKETIKRRIAEVIALS